MREPGSLGQAAARFGAALAHRYRRRQALAAVPLLFPRYPRATPSPAVPRQPGTTVHLAPRIEITVSVGGPRRAVVARDVSVVSRSLSARPPAGTGRPGPIPVVGTGTARQVGTAPAMRLATPRPPTTGGRVERHVPPVPAVLRHREPEPAPRTRPAAPDRGTTAPAVDGVGVGRQPRPAPMTVGEVDLRRLTDDVVRRIDQRIVAQRERRGRP